MIIVSVRHAFLLSLLAWFATLCQLSLAALKLLDNLPPKLQLYIGGSTKDVKLFSFDTAQGTFALQKVSDALGPNVSWLEFDKTNRFLFSTSIANFDRRERTGGIFSALVAADGTLQRINAVPSPEAPVSLEISPDGKLLMVATFNGASVTTYKIFADGKLSFPVQNFTFFGSGPIQSRQAAASAHQVKLDPSGRLLLIPDLGSDTIRSFSLERNGNLVRSSDIAIKPGCAPRHVVFAPPRKGHPLRFYMICELTNEILLIELPDIKPKTAALKQIMSTLPQGANPKTFNAAELLITPDGKFIYSLNQQKDPAGRVDDNTFAIYSRNDENDQLTPVGFVPSGGKGPRQFAFSPDKAASFIVVTCHESNLVTIHRRDATSGALNQVASVPSEGPEIALFRV